MRTEGHKMPKLTLKDYQAQAQTTYLQESQMTEKGIAYTTMGLGR